jgi:hypothetical protein
MFDEATTTSRPPRRSVGVDTLPGVLSAEGVPSHQMSGAARIASRTISRSRRAVGAGRRRPTGVNVVVDRGLRLREVVVNAVQGSSVAATAFRPDSRVTGTDRLRGMAPGECAMGQSLVAHQAGEVGRSRPRSSGPRSGSTNGHPRFSGLHLFTGGRKAPTAPTFRSFSL